MRVRPMIILKWVFGLALAGYAGAVATLYLMQREMLYRPPFWVHALLWGPLILLTTLLPLRPMKGLLIALQYHHKAAEGRIHYPGDP